MEKCMQLEELSLGVCYYPEHWPQELWEDDFRRMKEHGIGIVRMAEFSWNLLEPTEGVFCIDWFDRAMDLAHTYGIKVILGTPTATPPAWLTHAYPETLNVSLQGVQYQHGVRRHYNYNAKVYQDLSARIVGKMGAHYANHPALLGWQIDNELNCEVNVFYSEADHAAFRDFLRNKYGTLDQLNQAWGTNFWSQTYTDWEQVFLSRPAPSNSPNPHLALDEKRFISESAIRFCKMQADILRKTLLPGQWITTNGLFGHIDNHRMTREALDFMTFDSYPNFAFDQNSDPKNNKHLHDRGSGMNLSNTRSISPIFGIMEQQSGPGGWTNRMMGPALKPGQMRLWAMQSIAHGADMVSFFRWRTAGYGTEIYWHGLNNYDNRPNRRLAELKKLHSDVASIAHINGARYQAKVALIRDYDNIWDGELDAWHSPLDKESEWGWFVALQKKHIPMDIVFMQANTTLKELVAYECIVYPHATILTDDTADLLRAYVQQGGKLVMGARTGYKDLSGQCPMRPMPGPVADLCGLTVTDFTFQGPGDALNTVAWGEDILEAAIFNDILEPTTGEAIATFSGNYFAGAPALVRKATGKGETYYFGAAFSAQAAGMFADRLGLTSPTCHSMVLADDIELAIRKKEEKEYCFLLNYLPTTQSYTLAMPMKNMLTGETLQGEQLLAPYDVVVLVQNA